MDAVPAWGRKRQGGESAHRGQGAQNHSPGRARVHQVGHITLPPVAVHHMDAAIHPEAEYQRHHQYVGHVERRIEQHPKGQCEQHRKAQRH